MSRKKNSLFSKVPNKKSFEELKQILYLEKDSIDLENLITKNLQEYEEKTKPVKNNEERYKINLEFAKKEQNIYKQFSKEVIGKFSKSFRPKFDYVRNNKFKEAFKIYNMKILSNKILEQNKTTKIKDETILNLSKKLNKNSNNINNDEKINSKLDKINTKLNENIGTTNLNQIYKNYKKEFEEWIFNGKKLKNSNLKTKQEHVRKTKRIFDNEIKTVYDFNKLRDNSSEVFLSRPNVNFRTFIEFCRDRGKLDENIALTILSKVEGKVKVNIDNYVPTEKEILQSLKSMGKYYKDKPYYFILYKIFIESGGRWNGAIQKMLLNFDETKLKKYGKFITYDIHYDLDENNKIIPIIDKTKLSFFLFIRTKTFNDLMKYKKEILNKNFLNNYKKYLSRDSNNKDETKKLKDFIHFKSIRKFVRTKLVECGVSSEFSDFIESRTDGAGGNIGFKIYQDKNQAVKEYEKYLSYLEKILD